MKKLFIGYTVLSVLLHYTLVINFSYYLYCWELRTKIVSKFEVKKSSYHTITRVLEIYVTHKIQHKNSQHVKLIIKKLIVDKFVTLITSVVLTLNDTALRFRRSQFH